MSKTVLNLKNVSKKFGSKNVLNSVNFSVTEGTIMGLVGKNGAGKTTMIKILLGLLKPDEGESTVFDNSSWNLNAGTKHRIGYVPQVVTGFRWMTVKILLDYTGAFYSHWNTDRVNSLLSKWNIDSGAKVGNLSVGERQKLAIIQAMGHEPDLYVFDEPVAGLDPVARRQFIKQLIDLNLNENKTMLLSTHILSDLERVAADIALLKDGKIRFEGDLSTLQDRVRRLHIQSGSNLPDPLPIQNCINCKIEKTSALVTVDGITDEEIKNIEKKLSAAITIEQLNLEDIFLELNK